MNLDYIFTNKNKTIAFVLMVVGIISIAVGFMTDHETHGTRVWANLLANSLFFLGMGICATFYIALNYAAEAAWGVALKRVFEAVAAFLPFGALALIIVLFAATMDWNHIYHWMAEGISTPGHENYDPIIAGKSAYLNKPFFWVRTLIYLGIWIAFMMVFRKRSLQEDKVGGTEMHFKNIKIAAWFLVLFAITSSTSAWDWIMSIDPHWFSTLFGWYTFSGFWISGTIVIIMFTLYLKSKGYLEEVNDSHIHDMGKWMFAVSFLWTYLWFSQFMLIWYSNIPEEVTYFMNRIENYRFAFFGMFIINFIFPMLLLMSRDTKRNYKYLLVVGLIIFMGHWMDTYVMVMPGATEGHAWEGFALYEFGILIGFIGLFVFVVQRALTKAPLMVKEHPYLAETINHHT
ncbi:MAG: quinol:cytochrome C oxidoreductase [Bacteroidota bacterium]|nr:quinol:cytochrome C oxidoreductase [Bacteroidota bacterium]